MAELHLLLDDTVIIHSQVPQQLYDNIPRSIVSNEDPKRAKKTLRFTVDHRVPDIIRYTYTGGDAPTLKPATPETFRVPGGTELPRGLRPTRDRCKDGSVVVLLESPHTDELMPTPHQPAAGPTGTKLNRERDRVAEMIHECLADADANLPVVICNPCSYPASCLNTLWGEDRQQPIMGAEWRDLVWDAFMAQERLRKDFITRLTRYRPSVIINACTSGDPIHFDFRRLDQQVGQPWGNYQPLPPSVTTRRLIDLYLKDAGGTRQRPTFFQSHNYRRGQDGVFRVPDNRHFGRQSLSKPDGHLIRVSHPASWLPAKSAL